jgi:hypothetical protein
MLIAVMIGDSPGFVSTMSDAARAASVAPWTAMPTSAFFSAGASLTPSPVIPQLYPAFCSTCTIMNLCSGKTPAKASASSIKCFCSRVAVADERGRASVPWQLVPIPRARQVSFAILSWSPVVSKKKKILCQSTVVHGGV